MGPFQRGCGDIVELLTCRSPALSETLYWEHLEGEHFEICELWVQLNSEGLSSSGGGSVPSVKTCVARQFSGLLHRVE